VRFTQRHSTSNECNAWPRYETLFLKLCKKFIKFFSNAFYGLIYTAPRKPRSDEGAAQGGAAEGAVEGDRPHRGGRGGRGGRGRHHGYIPPKRGFEHDRSVSRTGRGYAIVVFSADAQNL